MNKLHITEIYTSIQGETSFTGFPTVFLRLSGCNLRCHWCDTPHSFESGKSYALDDLFDKIKQYSLHHICITGGEPLLQKGIYPLLEMLCDANFIVSIETNGSLSTYNVDPRTHIILDIKCPGSGFAEKNLWNNLKNLRSHDEIKFVIADRIDFEYAKDICKEHDLWEHKILFSPAFNLMRADQLSKWIINDKLPVRLNMQTHKYIWAPEKTGV